MTLAKKYVLEKTTHEFINTLEAAGGKPLYQLSIEEARAILENLQSQPVEKPDAYIEDHIITQGTQEVSIRIVRPLNTQGTLPVIMYCHGGGWILGSKHTHDRLIRDIVKKTGVALVFINYTPSPEAQYPVAVEEAYAATQYIAERGAEFNLDGSRLAIVGDSVGGNMATVVALLAQERKGPKIACQVLFYPVTDAHFTTDSYETYAEGPWLTRAAMQWFWDAYAPNHEMRTKSTVSPLQATLEELAGMPPTLLIVDENDVLRDEGEAYARKLITAGVQVTAIRYLATIHDFLMLNPLSKTHATQNALQLACDFLKDKLSYL